MAAAAPGPLDASAAKALADQIASAAVSKAAAAPAAAEWWQLAATDFGNKWAEASAGAEQLKRQVEVQAKQVAKKGIKIPGDRRVPAARTGAAAAQPSAPQRQQCSALHRTAARPPASAPAVPQA
jgi:hypothetical protein